MDNDRTIEVDTRTDRRTFLRGAAGAALALPAASLALGVPGAAARQYTIGLAMPVLDGVGVLAIKLGFEMHARAAGVQVITENANSDAARQANQIDSFIQRKVDAIACMPVDSAAIIPSVKHANAAGIPFFCIDRAATGGKVVITVESDNVRGGQQAGQAMVAALTKKHGSPKGMVLELQGDMGTDSAQGRSKGFRSVLDKYPQIKYISKPTFWNITKTSTIAHDVAASMSNLDGIFLPSDSVGVGVPAVLKSIGRLYPVGDPKHVILVGVDGTPAALANIRKGYLDATASQPLLDFGLAADYAKLVLGGKTLSPGSVVKAGAPWSPAQIRAGSNGLVLLLSTTLVTARNAADPALYGNQVKL